MLGFGLGMSLSFIGRAPLPLGPLRLREWAEPRHFVSGTGTQTVAMASAWIGPVASYSLTGTVPSGVTINSATGLVSVTTGAAYPWATVTVRGTNAAGGYSDVTLELRVITPTHTINLGTGESYYSVSPTAGSVVVIRAGTSSEVWYLDSWDAVEVFAYPGEAAIINASGLTADNAIDIGNAVGLSIYGLEVIGGANAGFGVGGWGATNIRLQSCNIHGFQRGAIYTGHNTHATSRPHTIRNCRLWDNVRENVALTATSGWGSGIVLDLADGSLVERCHVYRNYGEGIRALACDGVTIRQNYVYDNYSANVYLDNVQGAVVTGNWIWSNASAFFRNFPGAPDVPEPAKSVLAANEEYPAALWLEQPSSGLVVTGNLILAGNVQPFYDGTYGAGGGAGAGSAFTPNSVMAVQPFPTYLGGLPARTGNVATAAGYSVASYFGGEGLSFSASGLPAGLSMAADGSVTGTPTTTGSGTVTVTATSPHGSAQGTFAATIAPEIWTPAWVSPGGTSYLSLDTASAYHTNGSTYDLAFMVRALDTMGAVPTAIESINGRTQVRFYSSGVLLVDIRGASAAVIGTWESTASQRDAGEWIYRVMVNAATPSITVRRINTAAANPVWQTVAGSYTAGPTTGTIDHNRLTTGADIAFLSRIASNAAGSDNARCEIAYLIAHDGAPVADSVFYDGGVMNPAGYPTPDFRFVGAGFGTGDNTGTGPDMTVTGTFGIITAAATPFPQAIGPGAAALGAYKTTASPSVVHVVNRNNSGAGSFRAAVTGSSPKIVVFDIGGIFPLASEVQIGANTTIIGETAPEPVTFTGARLQPASSTVLTGIRVRAGDDAGGQAIGSRDCITIPAAAQEVMVAYCSMTWGPDEAGGAYAAAGAGKASFFTWQDCLIAEGFVSASHPDNPGERHNFGPYFSGDAAADSPTDWAFARNLVTTFRNRVPAFRDVTRAVIAENLIYNWQNAAIEGYGLQSGALVDIRANAFASGPMTGSNGGRRIRVSGSNGTIGVLGNTYNGSANDTVDQGSALAVGTAQCAATYAPTLAASAARTHVLANAGARAAGALDSIDQRIVDYVTAGGPASGAGSSPTADVTDFRVYDDYNANLGTAARADTNGDGVYDAYEVAMGRTAGALSPHTLINATIQSVNARWNGHRQIVHQAHWLRTGSVDA